MPVYTFKYKNNYIDIVMGMDDPHEVFCENGELLERIWSKPQAHIKENFDINNSKEFSYKTGKMKGSLGDITNLSEELSQKRAKNSDNGRDPVKDKFFDNWSKKRHGKTHPEDNR